MIDTTKLVRFALPTAIVGVGIAAAVMLGHSGETTTATIPSGTMFVAELEQSLSTDRTSVGDHVTLHTVHAVGLDDETTVPSGITLRGVVTHVKGGGRIAGAPELALHFTELELDGRTHSISTEMFSVKGKSDATESALEIGGGAVVGGVLRGAKGAIVGAAIGTGVAVATEGDQLRLGAGQRLRIRLDQPVTVQFRPQPESRDH
ncbi:MAG: hypothetical protein ACM358_10130 [Gemmatimonadota bacterium]